MRWCIGAVAPFLLVSAAFAQPAPVKSPKLVEVSADGATIYFAGTLDLDAFVAFSRALGEHPGVKQLVIASQGGEVRSGQLMASSVTRRKIAVHVEHLCASACTLILLAAADRSMGPDARIGFHKSYFVADNAEPVSPDRDEAEDPTSKSSSRRTPAGEASRRGERYGDRTFRKSMEAAGIEADFIEQALSTPSADMWYPDPDLLLQSHVITRIAEDMRTDGPSWGIGRENAGEALHGSFWQALKVKRPPIWARKVDDVWRSRNAGVSAKTAEMTARSDVIGDLALDIARAPDDLLGRILAIHGAQAMKAREDDYRICRLSVGATMMTGEPETPYLLAEEDAALAELLQLSRLEKPIKAEKAGRIVGDFAVENIPIGKMPNESPDMDTNCRDGLQVIEAIDAAPGKQRIQVYRALMSLIE